MKKTAILFVCLLFLMAANAQEKRKVGSFSKINVKGSFDVTLVSGKGELTIRTDADDGTVARIITEVTDNTLNIYFEKSSKKINYPTKKIAIEVPFEQLDEVVLAGSGSIVNQDKISAANLKVKLTGSGDVELSITAKNTLAELTGSGDLKLKGKTDNLEATVVGSGDLHAFDLLSGNTEVTVSGSGDGNVYASETIKARVNGSGNIKYKGSPKKEDTKVAGSGDIEKS